MELNSAYFEIQRSTDGKKYVSIGKVPAAGNSNSLRQYTYIDDVSDNSHPIYFYRLNQVDQNGHQALSSVAILERESSGEVNMSLFPNPSSGGVTLQFTGSVKSLGPLRITDAVGKTVYYQPATRLVNNVHSINLHGLAKGTYLLTAEVNNQVRSMKLIKY